MITDYFRLVLRTFLNRRLRSFLTIFGIILGITAIISLMTVGSGMQNAIGGVLSSFGSDKIFLSPGGAAMGPTGTAFTSSKITEKDIDLVKQVEGVEHAIPIIIQTAKVTFGGNVKYLSIFGAPDDEDAIKLFSNVDFYKVSEGRNLKEGDNLKANIGVSVHDGKVFNQEVSIGDSLQLDGKKVQVVGVLTKSGVPNRDRALRLPIDTAREVLGQPDLISMSIIKVKDGYDPIEVSEDIKKDLRRFRDVKEGEEDFSLQVSAQLADSLGSIFTITKVVLGGIAAISLLVGGIGITNTMFTSVTERTYEIGIMKAVGAANGQIALIFLVEAGTLGAIGGLVGITLGSILAKGVELLAISQGVLMLKADLSLSLALFSVIFSVLLGTIAGIIPAIRASRLAPVEAMRHE